MESNQLKDKPRIHLIRPGSFELLPELSSRLDSFRENGFPIIPADVRNLNIANFWEPSGIKARSRQLNDALLASRPDVLMCVKGGYGSTDLLGNIPFQELQGKPAKLVVGFSDISALQMALYTQLNWPSIHGPMPGTKYWGLAGDEDVRQLQAHLGSFGKKGYLPVSCHTPHGAAKKITGPLLGGCLSVLTNLIGTPFMPQSMAGAILFFEDIDEPLGRIARFINQWVYAGLFQGIKALVLGKFVPFTANTVLTTISSRIPSIPIFTSNAFGHSSPNFPLGVGSEASIEKSTLTWQFKENS